MKDKAPNKQRKFDNGTKPPPQDGAGDGVPGDPEGDAQKHAQRAAERAQRLSEGDSKGDHPLTKFARVWGLEWRPFSERSMKQLREAHGPNVRGGMMVDPSES